MTYHGVIILLTSAVTKTSARGAVAGSVTVAEGDTSHTGEGKGDKSDGLHGDWLKNTGQRLNIYVQT